MAVKVLLARPDVDEDEFMREVEMLENCRHPNVVPVVGYCKDRDGKFALIMPLMKCTLDDCLNQDDLRHRFDW